MAQSGNGRVERALAGQHDRLDVGREFLGLGDDFDAVEPRHVEVDEDAVEVFHFERGGGGEAVRTDRHPMTHPRNLELHQFLQRALVVGEEEGQTLVVAGVGF